VTRPDKVICLTPYMIGASEVSNELSNDGSRRGDTSADADGLYARPLEMLPDSNGPWTWLRDEEAKTVSVQQDPVA
jgi:hypothetical protein